MNVAVSLLLAGAPAILSGPQHESPHEEEEILFGHDDVRLAGTLLRPASDGRHPALLFLQGSGEHARESALPVARRLAELGLVALAFDKRGTGRSNGDWRDASLEELVADAQSGLAALRARPEVDAHRVGLWAPSQGAWVASALCARGGEPNFVITVSGGGVTPREAERWAHDCRLRAAGATDGERLEAAVFVERYLDFLAGRSEEPAFEPALGEARNTSWWSTLELERILPFVERRATWSWLGTYDPRADLEWIRCPVLVLMGGEDELLSSALASERWRAGLWRGGNDDAVVRVFPGADHYLRASGAEHDPQAGEFLPAVQAVLEDWLRERVLASRAAPEPIAFVDVAVLAPEEGRMLPGRTVLVRGPRIERVGLASEVELPEGTHRIDGSGRFLVPGLVDAHVHAGERDLALFLANGVTTVRELNGSDEHLLLRERVAAGELVGPRLVVTSPLLAGTAQRWRHILVGNPDAAWLTAERCALQGYQALKVYDGLSEDVFAALEETARTRGLRLIGHVPEAVGLERVLAAGQELQHVEQLARATVGHRPDPARIPEIAGAIARAGVTVTPTLAAQAILCSRGSARFEARFERPELAYVDADTRAWWESLRGTSGRDADEDENPFYSWQRELVRALSEAGVPLLVGTDTPNPLLVAGFSVHDEILALADAGLTPVAILRAATVTPARALGLEHEQGRVAEGQRADLVLLDTDPLEDLDTLRRPSGVLAAGRWLDERELARLLEAARVR